MGKDKDHPLVASLAATDHMGTTLDTLQTLFDAPHQIVVHLGRAVRQEHDPSSSESHSWDLLLGAPLRTALPTSALR